MLELWNKMHFEEEKNGEYITCLKYLLNEYINVNNTGTKYVIIMKQTTFKEEKNREYIPCLKYSLPKFVE